MIFDKFLSLLPSELDGALIMSEENRRYSRSSQSGCPTQASAPRTTPTER